MLLKLCNRPKECDPVCLNSVSLIEGHKIFTHLVFVQCKYFFHICKTSTQSGVVRSGTFCLYKYGFSLYVHVTLLSIAWLASFKRWCYFAAELL